MKKQKPIRLHATMDAELAEKLKRYLHQINDDKSLKYVSVSAFIGEAVTQLLSKELAKG